MRSARATIALVSVLLVTACQTVAGPAAVAPQPVVRASPAQQMGLQTVGIRRPLATTAAYAAPAFASSNSRRTILIVAAVAVVIVAAALLLGGDENGGLGGIDY